MRSLMTSFAALVAGPAAAAAQDFRAAGESRIPGSPMPFLVTAFLMLAAFTVLSLIWFEVSGTHPHRR